MPHRVFVPLSWWLILIIFPGLLQPYLTALAALNEATQVCDVHLYRVDSNANTSDTFTKVLESEKNTKFASQTAGHGMSHLYRSRNAVTSLCSKESTGKEGEPIPTSTVKKENLIVPKQTRRLNNEDDKHYALAQKKGSK